MVGLAAPSPNSSSSSSSNASILIGISMDEDGSKELLSWAISILAQPNDTVVALHILEGEKPKKLALKARHHKPYQRSKAFVISVMADFAKICQSRQVYLQARVRYSSSIEKGLIEEARAASAGFLVLGGSKARGVIAKYCFNHAPKGCSIMSIGRCGWSKEDLKTNASVYEGSPVSEKSEAYMNNRLKSFPRTVLINKEKLDSPSFSESSSPPPLVLKKHKRTPLQRIVSSLFRLPIEGPQNARKKSEQQNYHSQPSLRCFSHDEISRATNDFDIENMVGRGGYSEVYRGDFADGSSIAVKRLAKDNRDPRKEKEFLSELGIIGHVSHPNTAALVGYCIENGLYLVFSYSPNGNLSNALHGNTCKLLEWRERYKIALGIARGLHYLHKCCKHKIIHRDIKASNVLLGIDYEPQITDFGLAKWLPSKGLNHAVAPIIEGTFGYLAPEYFMHGMVDEKTDVYAFGVLLLEMVTGRRPVDHLTKQNLLLWSIPLVESGKIEELIDSRLQGAYDMDQVHRLVLAASHCVQQSSSCRPSMTEVLELLEDSCGSYVLGRMPKISTDQLNDYSMAFGYNFHIDFNLEVEQDW